MKRIIIGTIIALSATAAQADIFKCVVDGKTSYQPSPCKEEKHESTLNLKRVDQEANELGKQRRADAEKAYLEKKLLKARIAQEQAGADFSNALSQEAYARQEAEQRRLDIRQQEADAAEERAEALDRYLNKGRPFGGR